LPSVLRDYEQRARQAQDGQWDYEDYLGQLLAAEIADRDLADRYERRSTIVTSNLAFSEWVRVFGDEKLTTALLDRLSHHAHILTTKGSSYRTRLRIKP
jgi:hypothetical protein